jgi:hypothetical protein
MAILIPCRVHATGVGELRPFESVRQCEATVRGRPCASAGAAELLARSEVPCLETGGIASGIRCLDCARLVNFVPARDRRKVTVRCVWTDGDPVTAIMIPAARLATVPSGARAGEAARLAADYGQDLLLVVDGCALVGVVRRAIVEWAAPSMRVDQLRRPQSWIVPAHATLGEAAALFAGSGADCVLVVDDAELLGMITREQLLALAEGPR